MSESIKTGDIYESAYYLSHRMELEKITCRQINGKLSCDVTFTGSGLSELQFQFFKGTATVNLFNFRRAYSQIIGYMNDAKKKFRHELLMAQQQGGRA